MGLPPGLLRARKLRIFSTAHPAATKMAPGLMAEVVKRAQRQVVRRVHLMETRDQAREVRRVRPMVARDLLRVAHLVRLSETRGQQRRHSRRAAQPQRHHDERRPQDGDERTAIGVNNNTSGNSFALTNCSIDLDGGADATVSGTGNSIFVASHAGLDLVTSNNTVAGVTSSFIALGPNLSSVVVNSSSATISVSNDVAVTVNGSSNNIGGGTADLVNLTSVTITISHWGLVGTLRSPQILRPVTPSRCQMALSLLLAMSAQTSSARPTTWTSRLVALSVSLVVIIILPLVPEAISDLPTTFLIPSLCLMVRLQLGPAPFWY